MMCSRDWRRLTSPRSSLGWRMGSTPPRCALLQSFSTEARDVNGWNYAEHSGSESDFGKEAGHGRTRLERRWSPTTATRSASRTQASASYKFVTKSWVISDLAIAELP